MPLIDDVVIPLAQYLRGGPGKDQQQAAKPDELKERVKEIIRNSRSKPDAPAP